MKNKCHFWEKHKSLKYLKLVDRTKTSLTKSNRVDPVLEKVIGKQWHETVNKLLFQNAVTNEAMMILK